MTSFQKGVWVFIAMIALWAIYQSSIYFFNNVKISGIQKNVNHSKKNNPIENFHCTLTNVNSADSITLLQNLNLPPSLVKRILNYKKKIKFFVSEKDFLKVLGIEEIFPKIQHCISFELPNKSQWNINTADSINLAYFLPNYIASRIYKYRLKKGGFQNWEDLKKIYGLDSVHLHLLQHFCYLDSSQSIKTKNKNYSNSKKNSIEKFNLNTMDSLQLEKLPKIGPKMASRIIKYKNLFPFFVDYSQLEEIYGINEEMIQILKEHTFIEIDNAYIPRNINELDYIELSKHPYIGKQNAKLLVNYRKINGNFQTWEDLKKVRELQLKNENHLKKYFVVK